MLSTIAAGRSAQSEQQWFVDSRNALRCVRGHAGGLQVFEQLTQFARVRDRFSGIVQGNPAAAVALKMLGPHASKIARSRCALPRNCLGPPRARTGFPDLELAALIAQST
jgi:hypothetical protein